ncbi:MAG: hypothetical protein K2M19_03945 [Muribaculaceae bacterium]|nr:hypothetical protein [Muribaculaceae bacterium]
MIISVHADYWLLGMPTANDAITRPGSTFVRILIEQLTVVGPNIFILISGYFGIRPKFKSFSNLIFQILFFFAGTYIIGLATDLVSFSMQSFLRIFLLSHGDWFIKAYIALYIIAPILNSYVEKTSKFELGSTVILIYTFTFLFGLSGAVGWIQQGYSLFSFIGLYLIARYIRTYSSDSHNIKWSGIFLTVVLCATCCAYFGCRYSLNFIPGLMVSYINPLVIIGSVSLFMAFRNASIPQSHFINRVSRSTFAVYLFPCFFVFDFIYRHLIMNVYEQFDGIFVIVIITGILMATFFAAVLIDQFRIMIWNRIYPSLERAYNTIRIKIKIRYESN